MGQVGWGMSAWPVKTLLMAWKGKEAALARHKLCCLAKIIHATAPQTRVTPTSPSHTISVTIHSTTVSVLVVIF